MFVARGSQLCRRWSGGVEYLCFTSSPDMAARAARVLNKTLEHPTRTLIERLAGRDIIDLVFDWIEHLAPYAFL